MTNPLLYDVKRSLTSKSVLIMMLVLILLSFALVPSFTATSTGPGSNNYAYTQTYAYYDSSGYHFVAFAWNQFGQGVSGITFQANLSTISSSPQSPPKTIGQSSGTTNSSGEAQFTISGSGSPDIMFSLLTIQPNNYNSGESGYGPFASYNPQNDTFVTYVRPDQPVPLFGSGGINIVTDSTNSSQRDIIVDWVGMFGAPPSNYSVYYSFENSSASSSSSGCQSNPGGGEVCTQVITQPGLNPQTFNESNMHILGTLNSYTQIFPSPTVANLSSIGRVFLALFYPNGTMLSQSLTSFDPTVLYPPPPSPITVAQGNSLVIGFFEGIFGLFVPLLAILVSYNSYGKDRISGVLESVLSQPVSRRGLSLSRFVSSFAAMSIAIFIAMGVVDGIVWHYTGSFVNSEIILSSAGAFLVELAAFTGIMMLLSRVVKSSGALIGIGIGLFIVIDFFWGVILALVTALARIGTGTVGYTQAMIFGEFVNPAQFVGLVDAYLTHQVNFVGLGSFGFPITPSTYGITVLSITATAILWIGLPLAAFLYLATKRD